MRLVNGVDGTVFSEPLAAEGAVAFAKACDLGLEGIVSKRAGNFYRSGFVTAPQLVDSASAR